MAELRVKGTGTIKLFENDNTSNVTIASPASLGADRTITLPDASVTLASGTMLATDGDGSSLTGIPVLTGSTNNTVTTVTAANAIQGEANLTFDGTTLDVTGSIAIDGNELFEEISTSIVASGNKTPGTNYDSTVDVTAGKWLPLVNLQVSVFENHGNANSTGIYLCYLLLGTSAGDSSYGEMQKTMMKWGNASNSYGDQTGGHFPIITLTETTTIHMRWYVSEYGTGSNYWVRGNVSKLTFIRVG